MITREAIEALYADMKQDAYKRKKYCHPGIYCIKINGDIVYVGKSLDMLERLAGHILEIREGQYSKSNKYRVLHKALEREDCQVDFDVLYVCRGRKKKDEIIADIGEAEAKYINELRPVLNYQIPTIGDYKHYTVNKKAKYITLAEILDPSAQTFYF